MLGDGARERPLVVARLAEPDRERPHRPRRAGHRGDDDARVDATREQRAERHIRDEAPLDGRGDLLAHEVEPVGVAPGSSSPSSAYGSMLTRPPSATSTCPGGSFSIPRRPVPPGTYCSARYASSCTGSGLDAQAREPQQCLHLGREGERAVGELRVDERLLPDAVTRDDEPLAAGVPEREREHAVEPLGEPDPCSS